MIMSSVHPWDDSRIFYKQATSLTSEYDVELHAVGDFKSRTVQGVKVYGLPSRRRLARPLNWCMLFFRVLKSKAKLVHFHDPELLPLGFVLKLFGRKVIYDIHEDFPAAIYSKKWIKGRKVVARWADRMEKFLSGKMNALIFAEQYYKENFTEVKVPKADILNYPIFSGLPISQRPDDVFNLIYAGDITEIRGALSMIEAVGYLAQPLQEQIHLFLVGAISPSLLARIQTLAEERGIGDRVTATGRVTLREVYTLYGQAHLGLALLHPEPNYLRSLATKIFEYMSVGIPVVASNFPLWRELVEGNQCGLTADPLNPRDAATKIEQILLDPELRNEMSQNGFAAFQKKYQWAVEESKLLALYSKVLQVKRSSGW